MIVLIDTSVWIRFLSDRAPYAAQLDRLLSREEVCGHAFVYGELLTGDKGGRKALLASYEQMYQALVVAHHDVVEFVRARVYTVAVLAGLTLTCWHPRLLAG